MSRRELVLALLVATACLGGAGAAHAQQASIVPILNDNPAVRSSQVSAISENGVLTGYFGELNSTRAFTSPSTGAWQLLDVSYNPSRPIDRPRAISANGRVIVGEGYGRAARWIDGVPSLVPGVAYPCEATGVSGDGSVIVGWSETAGGRRAFRYDAAGPRFIGTFGEVLGTSEAYDVTPDGKYVVGTATHEDGFKHAFRWSQEGGLEDLGTYEPTGHVGNQAAFGISPDGQIVVGQAALLDNAGRLTYGGFVWTEADGMRPAPAAQAAPSLVTNGGTVVSGGRNYLIDGEQKDVLLLLQRFGVSTTDYLYLNFIHDMSHDGTRLVGSAELNGELVGVAITFPPLASIKATEELPQVVQAPVGQKLTLPFQASGPAGESLTFSYLGAPVGASVTPAPGPRPSAFGGSLEWTPTEADLGDTYDVRLSVRDFADRRTSMRFKLEVIDSKPPAPPTVEAPLPIAVECTGGKTLVNLQARVDDPDTAQLNVTWLVNGQSQKTQTVPAGSLASFDFAYEDGENEVTIRVSDGSLIASETTAVTVRDTTKPLVVVAPSATLRVELGQTYAWATRLAKPNVTDACDEAPKVTNNAPALLPIGVTYVLWTVADAAGNVAYAVQTVNVTNAAPVADAGNPIVRTTRNGRKARIRLDGRGSSDPDQHQLTYFWYCPGVKFANPTSPLPVGSFPVGVRFAKLTVRDAAGAISKSQVRIRVVSQSPRRPRTAALRHSATAAYETAAEAEPEATALAGLQAAAAATVLDGQADAALRAADASGDGADLANYFHLRGRQSQVSREAAARLYRAYLQSGDPQALFGSVEAYRNSAEAALDLAD
ncbi:MAG TPA: hypothetical protein VGN57_17490 [Pirellulaceae bacterium]|jgi:probable HAF family extracellular repeat protein|nr:hypothetical protein [Pirellulaceae bacterium]